MGKSPNVHSVFTRKTCFKCSFISFNPLTLVLENVPSFPSAFILFFMALVGSEAKQTDQTRPLSSEYIQHRLGEVFVIGILGHIFQFLIVAQVLLVLLLDEELIVVVVAIVKAALYCVRRHRIQTASPRPIQECLNITELAHHEPSFRGPKEWALPLSTLKSFNHHYPAK